MSRLVRHSMRLNSASPDPSSCRGPWPARYPPGCWIPKDRPHPPFCKGRPRTPCRFCRGLLANRYSSITIPRVVLGVWEAMMGSGSGKATRRQALGEGGAKIATLLLQSQSVKNKVRVRMNRRSIVRDEQILRALYIHSTWIKSSSRKPMEWAVSGPAGGCRTTSGKATLTQCVPLVRHALQTHPWRCSRVDMNCFRTISPRARPVKCCIKKVTHKQEVRK